jgi:hypothetical protein
MSQYLVRSAASNIDYLKQSVIVESPFSQALDLEFSPQAWGQEFGLPEPF